MYATISRFFRAPVRVALVVGLFIGASGGVGCASKSPQQVPAQDARAAPAPEAGKTGAAQGPPCGSNTCAAGEVCCNESCGICTPPGGMCLQQVCE